MSRLFPSARSPLTPALGLLCWTVLTGPVGAHSTEDMKAIRQALDTWTAGLMNRDFAKVEALLAPDFEGPGGQNRETYVRGFGTLVLEFPARQVQTEHAFFQHEEGGVRVSPILLNLAEVFHISMALSFVKTDEGWRISRVTFGETPPDEVRKPEVAERYQTVPVKVRLRDQAGGRPVFARIHVRDSQGVYWPPQGHMKNIPTGWREDVGGDVVVDGKTYAYVSPESIVHLKPGRYTLEVMRGIEYEPYSRDFEVGAGSTPQLDVELKRWSDIRRDGWYSGDTHVHFLSPSNGVLEAQGEDLNVINILATKWGDLITDVEYFSGRPDPLSTPDHVLYVNEETRHNFLGHTVLLNLKKLVYPLTWGPPNEGVPGGIDYPPMARQADEAHAQGGIVGWAHFPGPKGELAIDIALGKVDSVDVMTWQDPFYREPEHLTPVKVWYRFLNCGFKVPATAGTDKMWNTQVAGIPRVYAKVEGPFSYQKWIDSVKAGKTFVTTGPILTFSAAGAAVGDTVASRAGQALAVTAQVRSRIPVQKIEIVQDGTIVAVRENSGKDQELSIEASVKVTGSSWVAARAYSAERLPYQKASAGKQGVPLMAHTSPIYIDVDGRPRRSPEDAQFFLGWVDEALEWLDNKAIIPDPSQKQEMRELFQSARRIYQSQLAR